MNIIILSDIHANLSALDAVLKDAQSYDIARGVLLGDHINYGMRPNEVISRLIDFPYPIDANIWGNHEKAVMDMDFSHFSSVRGKAFASYTEKILTQESKSYIANEMNYNGFANLEYDGKRYLTVHASISDKFWKAIDCENIDCNYIDYDYALFGHSHIPLYFEKYFTVNNQSMRNKKKTVFINPGSVGQPRNHNNRACYAVLDTISGRLHLNNVEYDIAFEQKLYNAKVDEFYKTRLERGI